MQKRHVILKVFFMTLFIFHVIVNRFGPVLPYRIVLVHFWAFSSPPKHFWTLIGLLQHLDSCLFQPFCCIFASVLEIIAQMHAFPFIYFACSYVIVLYFAHLSCL